MRITGKGQVTTPKPSANKPAPRLARTSHSNSTQPASVSSGQPAPNRPTRGDNLVQSRRGAGDFKMTTDEILALMRGPPPPEKAGRRTQEIIPRKK